MVDYSYDAFNRLVTRTLTPYTAGAASQPVSGHFVYDGDNMVLTLDDAGNVTNRALYGPAVDQVFADEGASDDVTWSLGDNQNTIRDLAQYNAATGTTAIVNHRVFSAFGQLLSETDPATGQPATVSSSFGYTGCYFDSATGLQWNVNRWYNPSIERWMRQDPDGFGAGDANLCCYCGNEPTGGIDPTGLGPVYPWSQSWGWGSVPYSCSGPGSAVPSPAWSIQGTPDVKALLRRYQFEISRGLSGADLIKQMIREALILNGGNVIQALSTVMSLREASGGPGVNDDVLASVDHFLNAFGTKGEIPVGLAAGVVAGLANEIYSAKKLCGLEKGQTPGSPPSPLTLQQYEWGVNGSWAAVWNPSDFIIGSPEWRSFMDWLDAL